MEYILFALIVYQLFTNHKKHKLIMAKLNELAGELNAVNAKLTKIGTETQSLLTKITELTDQLANQDLPADAQTALDALKLQADVVDGLVTDIEPTEPTPGEGEETTL